MWKVTPFPKIDITFSPASKIVKNKKLMGIKFDQRYKFEEILRTFFTGAQ